MTNIEKFLNEINQRFDENMGNVSLKEYGISSINSLITYLKDKTETPKAHYYNDRNYFFKKRDMINFIKKCYRGKNV